MSDDTEDTLIEQPAIKCFADLGWETVNAFHKSFGAGGTRGRDLSCKVVLAQRPRAALARLNRDASTGALQQAVNELTRDRSALSAVAANRKVYRLLKDGVKVRVPDERERDRELAARRT
jgi:type I restriction enzyme, R subunit